MRSDFSTVVFLSVLSAVRQVNSKHFFHLPLPALLAALPLLSPVICILDTLHFCSLFSSLSYRFLILPPVLFISSPSFVLSLPSALLAPLLFVLMINCCLQAESEVLILHWSRCVFWCTSACVCVSHTGCPRKFPLCIKTHTCTLSPDVCMLWQGQCPTAESNSN